MNGIRLIAAVALVAAAFALGCGDDASVSDGGGLDADSGDGGSGDSGGGDGGSDGGGSGDAGSDDGGSGACSGGGSGLAVDEVRGSIVEGGEVVVCGAGFGDVGPTILLFDDMERGSAGEPLAETDPAIGEWIDPGGRYVDDASRSGDLAMLVNDTDITGGSGVSSVTAMEDAEGQLGMREFDEVFVHLSIRDLEEFPGNDSGPMEFSSDSSAKDVWVMFGDRGDNYDYSCSTGTCNGNDIVIATHTGDGSFKTDGNTTSSDWWLPGFWEFQAWNTMSTYMRIDPDAPYASSTASFEHVSAMGGYTRDDYDGQIMRELDMIPPRWDRLKLGAWYRSAGDVRRVMDDLYVAIGPGAPARVEIADAPRVEDATKIAVSTVTSWSPNEVAATVRLGNLDPSSDDLYLFVVDANNERTSGYAL